MFSGPPGNLFSILTNVVFTSSFVYLCYNMCIFSHHSAGKHDRGPLFFTLFSFRLI